MRLALLSRQDGARTTSRFMVRGTQADFGRFLAYRSFETTDADAFDGTGHKNGLCAQRGRAQLRFRLLVALQYKPTESDSCIDPATYFTSKITAFALTTRFTFQTQPRQLSDKHYFTNSNFFLPTHLNTQKSNL